MWYEKLQKTEERYHELENLLASQEVIADLEQLQKYSKELSELKELIEPFKRYKNLEQKKKDAETMLADEELKELAAQEIKEIEEQQKTLQAQTEELLIPKDPNDNKNLFLEIRAGTGGEEAALFAGDLFRMYLRFAERHGFKTSFVDTNPTGLGGYKEAIIEIKGKGAYSKFKFEGGTHRVQRVPHTEASGRIHTSAATVAIMPEAEDVDMKIDEKDLRIDTYRAGGAGGQNVNKVSSAIRITHIPSGLVVACQEERSQHQNRAKAMKLLQSRLLDAKEREQREKRAAERKVMVGSGDRSEKIRTYNFPQSRITDHRIGFTTHNLQGVLDGELDAIIDALAAADRLARLEKID
ncbi:MAG: peptide chain release factor 1 [Candidatus Saganbacteria bacterium]|nr:peptide chain release factor 1 [Candidatus Saganbacteria bacterium]